MRAATSPWSSRLNSRQPATSVKQDRHPVRLAQRGASPVAAPQVQVFAVVLQKVQFVRREAVLIARVEHDHFLGVQLDVGPNEKKVVSLASRLVEEPLDADDSSRDIPIQGLKGDRVMSTALPG